LTQHNWHIELRRIVVAILIAAAVSILILCMRTNRLTASIAIGSMVICPLVVPTIWLSGSLAVGVGGPLPFALPRTDAAVAPDVRSGRGFGGPSGRLAGAGNPDLYDLLGVNTVSLVSYLNSQQPERLRWDLGVASARFAQSLIIENDLSVMAFGGFRGTDPILDEAALLNHIADGDIRFFLTIGAGEGGPASSRFGRLTGEAGTGLQRIVSICVPVSAFEWNEPIEGSLPQPPGLGGLVSLYDCGG
jgi:hypothetical protein